MARSKVVAGIIGSLVLGVLVFGLSACGSKDSESPKGSGSSSQSQASQPSAATAAPAAPAAAPAQGTLNAAEFFTKADAEAVLGKPVNDPSLRGNGVTVSSVNFGASDFSAIALQVNTGATTQNFDQAQAASKSISGADPVPVAGVGEKAYWAGGKLNQLNILKNSKLLIITVMGKGDQSMELAKQAAQKILPRVP